LKFTVDSGAADVTIPADVFSTLMRAGTIEDSDMLGTQTYILADGSTSNLQTFRIRSLKVGDTVLENVTGSVADTRGTLLLGQSFLRSFKSWSIDNSRHMLVLVPK
jgi:predicted aspartyl protease